MRDLCVGFINAAAWALFVTLWPYEFVSFRKKVYEKDKKRATWLAAGGIACDIVIATGFQLDSYFIVIGASVAYAALTWFAVSVQMKD